MKVEKQRLDKLLVQRGLCESREKARALILAGKVVVNNNRVDKAGTQIAIDAELRLKTPPSRYVSRGGLKMEAALDAFSIALKGRVALDLGASTGGFSDCLLQKGCSHITAVDVGYGQLHQRLRADDRVLSLERTNARYLTREILSLGENDYFDIIVADLSFISLRLIVEPVLPFFHPEGDMILLVKPQFEAGRGSVGKGGVVRDDKIRQHCADQVSDIATELNLQEMGRIDSPTHGPKGNIEILMWLKHSQTNSLTQEKEP